MTLATQYERYMLDLINAERAKVGADALKLEQNLNTSADAHSEWMLEKDIFSHTGVGGSSATQRMRDAGFDLSGSWRTAENIAVQSERGPDGIWDDVENLHTSLMNSDGHRANILNPDLDYIGIGIALGEFDFNSGTYTSVIVTQNFASTGGSVDLDTGNTSSDAPALAAIVLSDDTAATKGNDKIFGDAENNQLDGLAGNDKIYGKAGNDRLVGGDGNDRIGGGQGNDRVKGGADNDVLKGGAGKDILVGGQGADRFVFTRHDDQDIIRDFQVGTDTLDLRNFDVRSLSKLKDMSQKTDADLIIDFGNGDELTIQNVGFNQISDDILI